MKKNLGYFLLLSFFLTVGCSNKPAAVVNGDGVSMKLFSAVFNENVKKLSAPEKNDAAALGKFRKKIVDQLIGEKLLIQTARKNKITVSDEELNKEMEAIKTHLGQDKFDQQLKESGFDFGEFRDRMRDQLLIKRYMELVVPENDVSEKEMMDYYKKSQKPFIRPARVLVRLIETKTKDEANAIAAEISRNNSNFDLIADRLGKENKAIVSDYGWVEPGVFSTEIADALQGIKKGAVGGPFHGDKSFYFLKVKDKSKEKVLSFREVKDQIRSILLNQKRQASIAHVIEASRKTANIKVNIP